jgi:pimeloyl-ACP methyl ester carboxylesterase
MSRQWSKTRNPPCLYRSCTSRPWDGSPSGVSASDCLTTPGDGRRRVSSFDICSPTAAASLLADITCPVLSITATYDHIAPAPQVTALNSAVSSQDTELLTVEGGHIGIVAGRNARENLWPQLAAWLAPRSAF